MQTKSAKKSEIKRKWHLVDLNGQILGRVSTDIAQKLIGKNKPNYTPNLDCGDYVVAINAKDIEVSGRKRQQKQYYHHTNYPGGLRTYTFNQLMEKDPRKVIMRAVTNMLPKNKLRQNRLTRLKIFTDDKHPYQDKIKD